MYLAWKLHHVLPSVYKACGYGEKKILGVFLTKEIDERNAEIEAMNNS
jgi:hypothetical protein